MNSDTTSGLLQLPVWDLRLVGFVLNDDDTKGRMYFLSQEHGRQFVYSCPTSNSEASSSLTLVLSVLHFT